MSAALYTKHPFNCSCRGCLLKLLKRLSNLDEQAKLLRQNEKELKVRLAAMLRCEERERPSGE